MTALEYIISSFVIIVVVALLVCDVRLFITQRNKNEDK